MCQLLINCHKFSGKLGFNFTVGLWMISHQKNKTMMFQAYCPGMEIVDLLESLDLHNTTFAGLQQKPGPHSHHPAALFSGGASHYSHSHPVCQCNFIAIDSSLSAPLLPVYSFNLHHLINSMRCVGEVQLFQVSRDPCTTVHMRETGWRPLSSLPKSLPSLPQSGSQPFSFGVQLTELFAQSSLIKDCDLCSEFCVLLCFTPVYKWNSHCQH